MRLVHLQRIRRQTHGHDVEEIEELRAELQVHALRAALAASEGSVLDEREIEVIKRRTAEGVAPQRAEAPLVRTGSVGKCTGIEKKSTPLSPAVTEIVFPHFARSRKLGLGNLIGTVDTARSVPGLLNS